MNNALKDLTVHPFGLTLIAKPGQEAKPLLGLGNFDEQPQNYREWDVLLHNAVDRCTSL
ncbi:MAG: hypothetical protein NPIRA04_27750 [Nitrospirales bacterium]|nr:MAG: hypothetical protein NPIRA04_27750 [Nitrospirales bacterium]